MSARPDGDFTIVDNIVAGLLLVPATALLLIACAVDMICTLFGRSGR